MKTLFLGILTACALAHTVSLYQAETGGYNVYFGNFGYHVSWGAE